MNKLQKIVNNKIIQNKNQNINDYKNQAKFITTFFPGLNKFNNVIKTAYPVLESSPVTRNLFVKPPRVIFKKPPNLKNILVRPKLPVSLQPLTQPNRKQFKSEPCKKPRCKTCKIMIPTDSFSSRFNDRSYPIVGNMNCHSSNVIYQLSCRDCPKEYIGQTITPLHIRMNKNRSDTQLQIDTNPISAHAMAHQKTFDNCYNLLGVRQNYVNNRLKLTQLEVAHQKVLKTKQPDGLNLRFG